MYINIKLEKKQKADCSETIFDKQKIAPDVGSALKSHLLFDYCDKKRTVYHKTLFAN